MTIDESGRVSTDAPRPLRFGVFTLDPVSGELWKGGEPLDLPPQPTRLLQMLARRPGRLVTREEIRKEIWGDTVVEFDQAINNAVRQIRGALGDDASDPSYIETVPRRGYRFVAPLEEDSDQRSEERRSVRVGGRLLGAMAGVVLIALGLSHWASGSVVDEGERITVTVVQTRAPRWEPATERFASILTEELNEALSALEPRGLSVIPWSWDMAVARDGRMTRDGQPVGVDFTVDSNIRMEDGWQAAVIVTKLPEGQQAWYRRFSVDPADPHRAASLIGEAVAGAMEKNLVEDRSVAPSAVRARD